MKTEYKDMFCSKHFDYVDSTFAWSKAPCAPRQVYFRDCDTPVEYDPDKCYLSSDGEYRNTSIDSAVRYAAFVLVEAYYQGITEVMLFPYILHDIMKGLHGIQGHCFVDIIRDILMLCPSSSV